MCVGGQGGSCSVSAISLQTKQFQNELLAGENGSREGRKQAGVAVLTRDRRPQSRRSENCGSAGGPCAHSPEPPPRAPAAELRAREARGQTRKGTETSPRVRWRLRTLSR